MQKEMMDERTNWPWSVQRTEKDNARSSASRPSSQSSEDHDEEDASLCDSQSCHSGSPARGLQFEMEENPFPVLPPPVSSQVAHSIPYGVLDRGGIRFWDGTRVDSAGNWSSKLRYVDEVDAKRKRLLITNLGKMKHE